MFVLGYATMHIAGPETKTFGSLQLLSKIINTIKYSTIVGFDSLNGFK